jgi:hypothetical protein
MRVGRLAVFFLLAVSGVPACSFGGSSSRATEQTAINIEPGAVVSVNWPRTVRAGTTATLFRVTHRNIGDQPISYRWAEVLERAPANCPLPIPVLTRASFDEAARIGEWPGEQVNLKPGDATDQTFHESLPPQCHGTVAFALIAEPVTPGARAQRRSLAVNVLPK